MNPKSIRLYLFLFSIFVSTSVFAGNDAFLKFATGQDTEIDLNQDGTPDVIREYKDGRLIRMIYRPSHDVQNWQEILIDENDVQTTHYFKGQKRIQTKIETPTPTGYTNEITDYTQSPFTRTVNQYNGNVVNKSRFIQKGNSWALVDKTQETLEFVERETTVSDDVIMGQPLPAEEETPQSTQREFDESEPLVFRIDSSCQGEDRRVFTQVTHHFFRNLLPCMHRFHPALAWELANNIRRHRTPIKCNQTSQRGIVAYTTTRRNDAIYWGTYASPSAIARNGRSLGIRNAGEAMGFLANSLMHEALHNLGIRHVDPIDPAYGCEVLCNEAQHTVPFSYQAGCRSCLGTRVAGSPSSVSQNVCNR